MASEDALQHTASLLLLSLSRVAVSKGVHAGETLDRGTVLITWTPRGLELCKQLPYKHRCVLDTEHRTSGSMGFHGQGFNALGFAKAKYILNTLAVGNDVLFLDADTLVLRDPLPYLLSRGADMSTSLDRCLVFNDTLAYRRHRPTLRSSSSSRRRRLSSRSARSSSSHHHHHSSNSGSSGSSSSSSSASQSKSQNKEPQSATRSPTASSSESATSTPSPEPEPEPDYLSWRWPLPPSNIGMLYFRASAAVTRCVYSWMTDMRFEADINPKMWDQDMYGRVLSKCAALLGLRWQALDPRLFQSACFKECGCAYEDADVAEPGRVGRDGGHLPYMARGEAVEAAGRAGGGGGGAGEDTSSDRDEVRAAGVASRRDTVDADDGHRRTTTGSLKDGVEGEVDGEAGGEDAGTDEAAEGQREGGQRQQQQEEQEEDQAPEQWEFDYMCDPALFEGWVARHFPCSGLAPVKAQLMANLLRGLRQHTPVRIRYRP